jgi:class 3 adenylate cyclase
MIETSPRIDGERSPHVTFLFTDIEGSTALWEQYPDAMRAALERHDGTLRRAIESSGGRVIKNTGDGLYAVFEVAGDAVQACIAAQRELLASVAANSNPASATPGNPAPLALRVRMGLHTGAAEFRDGDYFGGALNRTARIMSAAHGGQVLLSASTAERVAAQLSEGVSLRDLGEHRLKGLQNPERLLQLVATGLPADFPPLESLTAHSLQAERDLFIGRDAALDDLARRMRAGSRLVSVLGLGGTGKTRRVTRFGWRSLGEFAGGVWFCDLSQARSVDGIVYAVAQFSTCRSARTTLSSSSDTRFRLEGNAW